MAPRVLIIGSPHISRLGSFVTNHETARALHSLGFAPSQVRPYFRGIPGGTISPGRISVRNLTGLMARISPDLVLHQVGGNDPG